MCLAGVDFKKGKYDNAESFTQMVWADTSKFGIASGVGKDGNKTCTYVVAVYRPVGNIEDNYDENVKVGKFKQKAYCDDVYAKKRATVRVATTSLPMSPYGRQVIPPNFLQNFPQPLNPMQNAYNMQWKSGW